jgi:adenine-specific DNA-methyltransferase
MNIEENNYEEIKQHYDGLLNLDKSTYKNSNDEPTPIGCIEEMLGHIPDEVWKDPHVEILDPCCGNGNFHLYAWKRFREAGMPNESIVKNNLFFNDINHARLENVKKIYGRNINFTAMDFLNYPEDKKYNVIYANPPFAKFTKDNKRASKNHTLVRDFLMKSLNLLKDGGYLVYIVPDNWMSLADRNLVIKELTKYQFMHLDIHGAKKWFPKIGSSFTWLVLRKTPAIEKYTVSARYKKNVWEGHAYSQQRSYIPLVWNETIQSIFAKTIDRDNEKFNVQTSSDLHKYTKRDLISSEKSPSFGHKLIHTPKQTVWAKRPHKFQEGYKCFISTTDKYSTFVDACGMTQSIAFIKCQNEKEASRVSRILGHELYVFLNNLCRWGNFNNIRILQKFPVPSNEHNIYESFGITEGEKKLIKEFNFS